ncbi:hypothetical protein KAFR_0E02360 [Kazachstania africana CBS 2517]|uniref:DNA polymerase gamma n=1 Tax=Kazachstania africana (strain ATCC 22294 / BCRC 22015 / CBS 2517 / CECT 1963 / NBRC 1671 / NRRL Y-8276) TaxID=1071382 RepID=H2AVI9_KAZAF|nr:hypothetical protein KAFR_0E02360 [Kazachstania africana CBS 2517]CCF58389.1 hypothetical protein KAFR_0E02360 [Kazachstania africana CBS 2517]
MDKVAIGRGLPLLEGRGCALMLCVKRRNVLLRQARFAMIHTSSKLCQEPRINPVGIQYLSNSLHSQLFGKKPRGTNRLSKQDKLNLIKLAKQSLKTHDLLNKKTLVTEPISFTLPTLQGDSLDEHFQRLGQFASEPYKTMAMNKFIDILPRPSHWLRKPGWYKYEPKCAPVKVQFPEEDTLVFDVETLYKISSYPTMAVALTSKAWYLWCSPFICEGEDADNPSHLIPLDTVEKTQLIIGHNVGYDRSHVLEEYNFKPSKAFFLDTQSLHVASSGLCSRQRPMFMKRRKEIQENGSGELDEDDRNMNDINDPWLNVSTLNSLADVADFHCNIKMDKDPRSYFDSTDKSLIIENFEKLVSYCATDVEVTSKVFDKVFPTFLEKCPHAVSFGALKSLSSCILPTNHKDWNNYIDNSENLYQTSKSRIEEKIVQIINEFVKYKDYETNSEHYKIIQDDPWMSQLDWTKKPIRMTKDGVPMKRQKLPGFPEWYRSLFPSNDHKVPKITIKSRNIPIFFKLSWEGYPVKWTSTDGWCFPVPRELEENFKAKNYVLADEDVQDFNSATLLFKIPHPDGPTLNCTTLLSKPYIHFFEKGILKSESKYAHEALQINSSGSYWMSARERIMSQFLVSKNEFSDQFKELFDSHTQGSKVGGDVGIILPRIIPMGTITRRAVENTWLTASNTKTNRIGSELKTQIKAPPGYCFVGADVDSEELWIASLVGDSVFNIHGGTAIGWMCLEGTKNDGTDLHTKTAKILGCTRNEAKIFNYGRIYGAGVKFAGQLLKRFNPTLTEEVAKKTATRLYESTKGKTRRSRMFEKFWYGGSESILFNRLENIAEQDIPRTPVLGCSITSALMKRNLKLNSFLPSRINWAIQSSGVDYLHLLCVSMNYLIAKYSLDARLCISIHDEIRYLCSEKDRYRVAMALQISNLWTRAIFCEQVGIEDLPQNCAFFSQVDIDHVMRKEVNMDCITPSNPTAIPHGEAMDITELLNISGSMLENPNDSIDLSKYEYRYREPVFAQYNKAYTKEFSKYFLNMQTQTDPKSISKLEREYVQEITEQKFAGDGINVKYDYSDYIDDVKRGKIRKINVMENSFVANRDELINQHKLIVEQDLITGKFKPLTQMRQLNGESNSTSSSTNYLELHKLSLKNPVRQVQSQKPMKTKKMYWNRPDYSQFYASIDQPAVHQQH